MKVINTREIDILCNIEKWQCAEGQNILYITGTSGSGKSTLTQELNRGIGSESFCLDLYMNNSTKQSSDNFQILEEYRRDFPEMEPPHRPVKNKKYQYDLIKFEHFMKYLINYMSLRPDKLFIIEGLQIMFFDDNLLENILDFKNKPFIIKDGSDYRLFLYLKEVLKDRNLSDDVLKKTMSLKKETVNKFKEKIGIKNTV